MDYANTTEELNMQIDRLSRKIDFLFRAMNLTYAEEAVPTYVLRAKELVCQGRDSEAIKIVREQTAVGTIEARAIVENLAKAVGRELNLESVVPPAGLAGALSGIDGAGMDQAAVEEAWRRAVRQSSAERLS